LHTPIAARLLSALAQGASAPDLCSLTACEATRTLADWCSVWLVDHDGMELDLVACHHRDPERLVAGQHFAATLTPLLERIIPSSDTAPHPIALASGGGTPSPGLSSPQLEARGTGLASMLAASLDREGSRLGFVALASADPDFAAGEGNQATLSALARELGDALVCSLRLQNSPDRDEYEQQKDEFLAMVAHELRTPLTSIKGYVQILLRRLNRESRPALSERETAMLQTVDHQVNRFTRLVVQLLDFSRIQAGKLEPSTVPFRLGELARTVVAEQQANCTDREISVAEEGDTLVEADHDRIDQVLTNLIINATKATRSGGKIRVKIRRDGDWVVTTVSDNGCGMAEEAKERMFERLYRGPGNSHEGLGLGLYVSKGVVEAHGGRIWFDSKLGKGSNFHFALRSADPGETS